MKARQAINRKKLGNAALGNHKADLVIKGAKVVDVFSQAVIDCDVAITDGRIVGLGNYQGHKQIDANGCYLAPGFIDSHIHIESTMVSPEALSDELVKRGTTCLIADPHEIANVKGIAGIRYMIEAAQNLPVQIYYMLPSCVPAVEFEAGGAILEATDLAPLLAESAVLGLGEMMNYPGLFHHEQGIYDKLDMATGRVIDGHGPLLSGKQLNDYALQGIKTDHECTTPAELKDRISRGMTVSIREGSASRDLDKLLPGVDAHNWHYTTFCTDDRHPEDIIGEGHIDYIVKRAVTLGVDPLQSITMATLNAAKTYGLSDIGAIAPGYQANLILLKDLRDFTIEMTFFKGQVVYTRGGKTASAARIDTTPIRNTVNLWDITVDDFKLPLKSDIVNVIRIKPRSLLTEKVCRKAPVDSAGYFKPHPTLDMVKLAVINRYTAKRQIGLGLLENYGLHGGAIATSISHDSHNIICVGDSDEDMHLAVKTIEAMQGGIALVVGGELVAKLPLPLGGLMSDRPVKEVAEALVTIRQVASDRLKVNRSIDPIMILSFLGLPVIPSLKLTSKGLFDVDNFTFVDVSVEE